MEQIHDYSDERLHGRCVFCGGPEQTADHVPSRIFLDKPYPENLACVPACSVCNSGFSLDEEYLACLLGCVQAGSTKPEDIKREKITRTLRRKPDLASRILSGCRDAPSGPVFTPETERVRNVIIKLARGHAAFELAATSLGEPSHCAFSALAALTDAQRNAFEDVPTPHIWPEVGSRNMSRLLITADGQLFTEQWIEVQKGRYRYAAIADPRILVRIVIDEFLAAEVRW